MCVLYGYFSPCFMPTSKVKSRPLEFQYSEICLVYSYADSTTLEMSHRPKIDQEDLSLTLSKVCMYIFWEKAILGVHLHTYCMQKRSFFSYTWNVSKYCQNLTHAIHDTKWKLQWRKAGNNLRNCMLRTWNFTLMSDDCSFSFLECFSSEGWHKNGFSYAEMTMKVNGA